MAAPTKFAAPRRVAATRGPKRQCEGEDQDTAISTGRRDATDGRAGGEQAEAERAEGGEEGNYGTKVDAARGSLWYLTRIASYPKVEQHTGVVGRTVSRSQRSS